FVIGPAWSSVHASVVTPYRLTRPYVCFSPTIPQNEAGPRIDPPVSVPIDSGVRYAASAAPDPLEDPDGEYSVFQGLRAGPKPDRTPLPMANSSKFSFPSRIAPAFERRSVTVDSKSGTQSAVTFEPFVVRIPLVARMSLGAYGRPCNGPMYLPEVISFSACRAWLSACSLVTVMNALS